MSVFYSGQEHTFFNENDTTVTIKPLDGQTLVIEGNSTGAAGSDTEVMFNDSGDLAGDTDFTYDKTGNVLTTGTYNGNVLVRNVAGDPRGYNELYSGTGTDPQTGLTTAFQPPVIAYGGSLRFSPGSNYLTISCPGTFNGITDTKGISMWNKSNELFTEYNILLGFGGITDDSGGDYTSINEDGDLMVTSLYLDVGGIYGVVPYTRSGSVWSVESMYQNNGWQCHLSGNYLFAVDQNTNFKVSLWSGSFALQQTIETNSIPDITTEFPMFITQGHTLGYYRAGNIKVWSRALTTWSLTSTLPLPACSDIDAQGNIIAAVGSGNVYIYETSVLTATIPIANSTYCTTNGTYVFVSTSTGLIYIVSKVSGVWGLSTNTTALSGVTKLSCNGSYLCALSPTSGAIGESTIYSITFYNGTTVFNSINMASAGDFMEITNKNGASFSADVFVSGNLYADSFYVEQDRSTGIDLATEDTIDIQIDGVSKLTVDNSLILSNGLPIRNTAVGSVSNPVYGFSPENSGLYLPLAGTVGITCAGVSQFTVDSTHIVAVGAPFRTTIPGTLLNPAYSFTNDTDTGIVNLLANSISVVTGGTEQLAIGSTDIRGRARYLNVNGDVSNPAYSFENQTQSGMWSSTDDVSISVNNVRKLGLWNGAATQYRSDVYMGRPDAVALNINNTTLSVGATYPASGIEIVADTTNASGMIYFYTNGITLAGSIISTGGATVYATTSDEKVKKNFTDCTGSCSRIKNVKVYDYELIDNEQKMTGVKAHELASVFPNLVYPKDPDPKRIDDPANVDQVDLIGLVPYLIQSVQELITKNEELTSEIATLKQNDIDLKNEINVVENFFRLLHKDELNA